MKFKLKILLSMLLLFGAAAVQLSGAGVKELNALLEKRRIASALPVIPRASDETFLRRATLKLAGRLPVIKEIRNFAADRRPDKRARLINRLINSPEFADMMAMRYCQIFRVKSEFPINMWPNAVQLFHACLRDSTMRDYPYDRMVRSMLTSSGSNFRVPGVNLIRGHADRTPEGMMRGIALSLMGVRLEKLDRPTVDGMTAFFSRVSWKSTDEWKEEVVFVNPVECRVKARTLTGETFTINSPDRDPRQLFANWLVSKDNPYFARAFANRLWFWLVGRGMVEPADDITGSGTKAEDGSMVWTPATTPELDLLAQIFAERKFSVKALAAVICNSSVFNADWKTPDGAGDAAAAAFVAYPVHRMEPEVIIDALSSITRGYERYRSVIPEPFTIMPPSTPAVKIPDGSISSVTLDNFGRSPRDTGRLDEVRSYVNASQRQWLMNSSVLFRRIQTTARRINRGFRKNREKVDAVYLLILSRYPTAKERAIYNTYFKQSRGRERGAALTNLIWALINSGEFLYHH